MHPGGARVRVMMVRVRRFRVRKEKGLQWSAMHPQEGLGLARVRRVRVSKEERCGSGQ